MAWIFLPGFFMGGVIWVIGWSMIILALVIYLDMKIIIISAITLIIGHNLFDGIQAEQLGNLDWFWAFLHPGTMISVNIRQICFFAQSTTIIESKD